MPELAKIVVFSTVAYVYLFLIAKFLGKKQIAQLTFIDYVVGITIGSIAAEMATETTQPFYDYLLAMTVFFVFDLVVSVFGRKSCMLKKIMIGRPIIVINDGIIDYAQLKKSKLSVDEVVGMARGKGYFDLKDIAFAVFETNGQLSVLPKSNKQPILCENAGITIPAPILTEYLIVDGKLSKEVLAEKNYSEVWIFEGLGLKNSEDLKNILVASYDESQDKFFVQYKSKKS